MCPPRRSESEARRLTLPYHVAQFGEQLERFHRVDDHLFEIAPCQRSREAFPLVRLGDFVHHFRGRQKPISHGGLNPSCRDPTLFRGSPYLQPRTLRPSLYLSPTRPEDTIKVLLNTS